MCLNKIKHFIMICVVIICEKPVRFPKKIFEIHIINTFITDFKIKINF